MTPGKPNDTPFYRYLQKNNLTVAGFKGQAYHAVAGRLAKEPHKVPSNSPVLAPLATALSMPLTELQAFAKGPPLEGRWLAKIQRQLENGTIPRGAQTRPTGKAEPVRPATKRRTASAAHHSKHPLSRFVSSQGSTLADLSAKSGVPVAVLWKWASGDFQKNHPAIDRIAKALGVAPTEIQRFAKQPAVSPARVAWLTVRMDAWNGHVGTSSPARQASPAKYAAQERARRANAKLATKATKATKGTKARQEGKAVVLATIEQPPPPDDSTATNGKHKPVKPYGPQNRLGSKRTQLQLRASARAMVSTLNVCIMRGDTHMPPIPVADLYLLLVDYLDEKGVKASVLVDPTFATVFDPK